MASSLASRAPGFLGCAALGGVLHFVGGNAGHVLPHDLTPRFVHDGAFNTVDGIVVGALCSVWYPFVEGATSKVAKRFSGRIVSGINGIAFRTLLDQMPSWGLSAIGGSIILVSALAADMALVQIHGFAFPDGALRPETFPVHRQVPSMPEGGDDTATPTKTQEHEIIKSPIGTLQAAAEAQRVATGSHSAGQRLPTWGPHDYCSHPNYALLQAKALQQGFDGDAPAAMPADASMVQPGGQLALDQLMATREAASQWWYRVSSSPAWPLGLVLSAVNFAVIPPAFRATFGIYQYTLMRMANHMHYDTPADDNTGPQLTET